MRISLHCPVWNRQDSPAFDQYWKTIIQLQLFFCGSPGYDAHWLVFLWRLLQPVAHVGSAGEVEPGGSGCPKKVWEKIRGSKLTCLEPQNLTMLSVLFWNNYIYVDFHPTRSYHDHCSWRAFFGWLENTQHFQWFQPSKFGGWSKLGAP